jgi:hypothetical protein
MGRMLDVLAVTGVKGIRAAPSGTPEVVIGA